MKRLDNEPLAVDGATRKRLAKLESLLRSEVGSLIERELELPANTLLTIVSVKLTADLSQVRFGVSVLPEVKQSDVWRLLLIKVPEIQRLINAKLRLYRVPKVSFYLDTRLARADRLDTLLDNLKEE